MQNKQKTIEWLQARQQVVNASEIASILAIYLPEKYGHFYSYSQYGDRETPYNTKYQLLWNKKFTKEQLELYKLATTNKKMLEGLVREHAIIQNFCERESYDLVLCEVNPEEQERFVKDGFGATMDAIVKDCFDTKYALEVKGPNNDENIIDKAERYTLQVQLQLYCAELENGFLYLEPKYGDNNSVIKQVKLDLSIIEDMKIASKLFWEDMGRIELYKPDFSVEGDCIVYAILNGIKVKPKLLPMDEAIALSIGLKMLAKVHEDVHKFVKDNLGETGLVIGDTHYKIVKADDILYTEESIMAEKERVQKLCVGDLKKSGNRNLKVLKVS